MICWLVEIELIWWFAIARESDLFVKDVRQVWEVWITHYLLNNERCKLLIYIKKQLQQVLVQQRHKCKKFPKTWMFKYKARLKHVQALPLHVVLSPWRSSSLVWH